MTEPHPMRCEHLEAICHNPEPCEYQDFSHLEKGDIGCPDCCISHSSTTSVDVLDIQIRFEGMKAENRMREIRNESPAYINCQFEELREELMERER